MKYPIFIPIKGKSKRCPGKNIKLLSIMTSVFKTYNINKEYNILDQCIIITESDELIQFAKQLGYNNIYKETEYNKSEFHAINRCINDYNNKKISFNTPFTNDFDMEFFFLAPVTQPLKSESFINRINNANGYDFNNLRNYRPFITTVTLEADRSIFEYNLSKCKFVKESKCRKGALCRDKHYIDGYWYFINSDFINNIVEKSDKAKETLDMDIDVNELFWSTPFDVVSNDNYLFCDVDTIIDMEKLQNTLSLCKKI